MRAFFVALLGVFMLALPLLIPSEVRAQQSSTNIRSAGEFFYDTVRREDGQIYSYSPAAETVFIVGDLLDVAAVGATSRILDGIDRRIAQIPNRGFLNNARREALRGARETIRLGSAFGRAVPAIALAGAEASYTATSYGLPQTQNIATAVASELIVRASPMCPRAGGVLGNACNTAFQKAIPSYISDFDIQTNADAAMAQRVVEASLRQELTAQAESDAHRRLLDAAAPHSFVTTSPSDRSVWFNSPSDVTEAETASDAFRGLDQGREDLLGVASSDLTASNFPPPPSPRPDLPVAQFSESAAEPRRIQTAQNQGVNLDTLRSGSSSSIAPSNGGVNLDGLRQAAPPEGDVQDETTGSRACGPRSTVDGVLCRAEAGPYGRYPNIWSAWQSGQISCSQAMAEYQRQRAGVRRHALPADVCPIEGGIAAGEAALSNFCGPAQPFTSCR